MKIALLGSKGFLGSRIAAEAMRRGWLVNHINSKTADVDALIKEADAVVHSVGSFMPDKRYKELVSKPVSLLNLAKLASLRLGLSPPNPLTTRTFDDLNFDSLKHAADSVVNEGTPFVFISAANWGLADPEYVRSKRKAEQYLRSSPLLRPVFLRPGFIAPEPALSCSSVTPRHLVDKALQFSQSPYRVDVNVVAQAACDAVEDVTVEGPIDCDVLQSL